MFGVCVVGTIDVVRIAAIAVRIGQARHHSLRTETPTRKCLRVNHSRLILPQCTIHASSTISTSKSFSTFLELVGGVAQWLGRRSVAGGLSLIGAWSMVDV